MTPVAFTSPFVPPEWIAAHGLPAQWMRLRPAASFLSGARGVCPFAAAMAEASLGNPAIAVVMATTCDQMRHAAALVEQEGAEVFLLNVPATWQTEAAQRHYREELERMGRFLVRCGGSSPSDDRLSAAMLACDEARAGLLAARDRFSARRFAEALAELRSGRSVDVRAEAPVPDGIRLALVGGPMRELDLDLYDLLERCGARVVLDATEGGERTLPLAFDPGRLRSAPREELSRAYFQGILDPFRRPNDPLHAWLGREILARRVQGVVVRRYLSCDLWHAEVPRIQSESRVPVLVLDAVQDDQSAHARTATRIEAFLEMLAAAPAPTLQAEAPS